MPNSNRQHHRFAAACVAVISALLLAACSITGLRWEDSDVAGPPLASGEATRQVRRCTTTPSPWAPTGHSSSCYIAFRSADGVHVDALNVQRDISAALPRALPLMPLLKESRNKTRATSGTTVGYTLYVVAVTPTIVVGIPEESGDSYYLGAMWKEYFLAREHDEPNQRGAQPAEFRVRYNIPPPVRPGSFVLVPEWQTNSISLSTEKQAASFSEKGTTITLVQRGNTWQSSRPVQ